MFTMMKAFLTSLTVLFLLVSSLTAQRPQQPEGWSYSLGMGALVKPKYDGGSDYDFWPIPYFDVKYGESFFFSPAQGLGYRVEAGEGFNFTVAAGFDFGRDEEDGDLLRGMGDIDFGILGLAKLGYEWGQNFAQVEYGHEVSGVHGGFEVKSSFGRKFMIRDWKSIITLSAFTTYSSEDYLNTYFGVDFQQSLSSGHSTTQFEAGLKDVGVSLNWIRPINDRWSFVGIANYSKFLGDIPDSPIVESDNQFFGGFFFVRSM